MHPRMNRAPPLLLAVWIASALPARANAQVANADSVFRTGPCRFRIAEPFNWESVISRPDHAPQVILSTMPSFPMHLRNRGEYSGRIVLAFVVDTLGRVEPATVSVEESTDPRLSSWGCLVALQLRYVPAAVGGHAVSALTEQAFSYSASRRP